MAIYYYSPVNDGRPSWGLGIIHYHVWLLNKNNIQAFIVYEKKGFKLDWLKLEVPVVEMEVLDERIDKDEDWLVIPEVAADKKEFQKIDCNKLVFVQNSFYIYEGLKRGMRYEELGIQKIIYIMPHLKRILNFISELPVHEIPPFVAPYYFNEQPSHNRKRRILLYPKFENKEYYILKRILEDQLTIKPLGRLQRFIQRPEWELVELQNKKHDEVPAEMQNAAFFISINPTEAFNTSVPEAMACGCINLCFEGVGPADFLRNGENAFVFSNDHIYELAEKLVELINDFDKQEANLNTMRLNAWNTVQDYKVEVMEKALINFYQTDIYSK